MLDIGNPNYIESAEPGPCVQCGKATTRVEVNYGGHLCSDECERALEPKRGSDTKWILSGGPTCPICGTCLTDHTESCVEEKGE